MSENSSKVKLAPDCLKLDGPAQLEWVADPKGYFLIRIKDGQVEAGFCAKLNEISVVICGNKAEEIYAHALKHGLVSRLEHAAYLGAELQKACLALHCGLPYVQDDDLDLSGLGKK